MRQRLASLCKAIEPTCIILGFESSPGFREKLAERAESSKPHRLLIHIGFFELKNFRTMKISAPSLKAAMPATPSKTLNSPARKVGMINTTGRIDDYFRGESDDGFE